MIYYWVSDDRSSLGMLDTGWSGLHSTLYHCAIWHSFVSYAGSRTVENPDKVVFQSIIIT